MLSDWELQYDRLVNKWVWVDIQTYKTVNAGKRKRYGKLKNGFYPYEFSFLFYRKGSHIQCSYCGGFFILGIGSVLTRDHVYPKSKGGVTTTPACRPCNDYKEDMKPIEFAIYYSKSGRDLAVIPIGFDIAPLL